MIRKHWKLLITTSIIILLPILAGVVMWNQLPEQVPSHWNAAGEIDGWSSKPFFVFGLPLILLAVQWLLLFVASRDKSNHDRNEKMQTLVLWIIPILSIVPSLLTGSNGLLV